MFRFKQFEVHQDRCAMKIGMDSMVLGAWSDVGLASSILDIGAGTGVLSLMAAQKNPTAKVTAIEIDPPAADQARSNVASSPWHDRIEVTCGDILGSDIEDLFDAIICNPPYFPMGTVSPDSQRATARHSQGLDAVFLTSMASRLLSPSGSLHVIFPTSIYEDWQIAVQSHSLSIHRVLHIHPYPGKPANRICLEVGRKSRETVVDTLYIRNGPGSSYSSAYQELTYDFHTIFP